MHTELTRNTDARRDNGQNPQSDFIRDIVSKHVAEARYGEIHTRFPPEPNGYLHIGHAKSICLNFGIAREFGGVCNLRMDDTNPTREEVEYVDSIIEDVNWLVGGWADDRLGVKPKKKTPETTTVNGKPDFSLAAITKTSIGDNAALNVEPFYASDYFEQIYEYALALIRQGKAYVCDLSPADTDTYRGAPDRPGKESPFRDRSVEENFDLFARMKKGEFPNGARTLRAKIDMASPNVWMRDPVLYRIRHAEHHHCGNQWCIYPMYDFAHCLSDYIEGITHSICTLEFEVHRPLYDWILENLGLPRPLPHQYEFSRLSLSYTVMSKRKLMTLVKERIVSGWDDPRMPTISGLRRRGVTPEALRNFACQIGVTKFNGITDVAVLEHAIRQDLNRRATRRLAVLRPIKVVLTNYPEGKVEEVDALNNPEDPNAGTRKVPFSRELFIEADDFMETPPAQFFRLRPGGQVRLKYAYVITCDNVVKDANGKIVELRCTADLDSRTEGPARRNVKGAIHWVSAAHALDAEVRLYDHLFTVPEPDAVGDFKQHLNPQSLEVVPAKCEASLRAADPKTRYQFERLGYFTLDKDSTAGRMVFGRTVTLRDVWDRKWKRKPSAQVAQSTEAQAPRQPAALSEKYDEITVKGKQVKTRAAVVDDVIVVSRGKWLKKAVVKDEWWLKAEAIRDPEKFLKGLAASGLAADVFTFGQRPPNTTPRYSYYHESENVAAIPITTFGDWWKHQITPDARQNIKKAWKGDVIVKPVQFNDDFVRSLLEIYNESPMRQGKPFYHYGKDFETAKRQNSTYADHTEFVGAYFESELIGFIQLNYMGQIADIKQIISKNKHHDKKPANALIAKAVELCEKKGISHLLYGQYHYYGNLPDDTLIDFKRRNGFRRVNVPRYYIPLTLKGRVAMWLKLHREPKRLIPESLLQRLLRIRARLFDSKLFQKRLQRKQAAAGRSA